MADSNHDDLAADIDIPLLQLDVPPPFENIHLDIDITDTVPMFHHHNHRHTKSNVSATSTNFSSSTLQGDIDPPRTCFQDYKDDWWLLEIASMTINILTITTMATLLSVYQNRPLSVWTFWLSLNTLISFLGTIAKTSLLYAVSASISQGKWLWFMKQRPLFDFETIESASQGVVGSVLCFWRLRPKNFISLGLVITISALFVGPVYQQVISYEGKAVPVHLVSTISSSQRLEMGTETLGTQSSRIVNSYGNVAPSFTSHALDFSMIAAIYNGLLSGNSSMQQHAAYSCLTGNCTFPTYASIGVCNQCTDVSQNLNKSLLFNQMPDGWSTLVGSETYEEDLVQYDLLPHKLVSMNNIKGMFPWTKIGGEVLVGRITALPNETIANTANELMVISTTFLHANNSYVQNVTTWEDTHIYAVECALSLCINVYNSSITDGVLEEEILSSHSVKAADSWQLRPPSSQPSTVSVIDPSDPDLGNSSWNPLWHAMWYNRTDIQLEPSTAQKKAANIATNTTFNITQTSIDTLQAFFASLAPNTVSTAASTGNYVMVPQQQYVLIEGATSETVRGQVLASSDFMRVLHGSENITETMEFLARSMTNAIRDNGAANFHFTKGTTWTFETFILVDWWLYIFPIGLSMLGSVLLVVAMRNSRLRGARPWKLNSLPILFHGLDEMTLKKAGDDDMLRIRHMEEKSMTMYVGLSDTPDGIKLVS